MKKNIITIVGAILLSVMVTGCLAEIEIHMSAKQVKLLKKFEIGK